MQKYDSGVSNKAPAMAVKACKCIHSYQDKRYGNGMRICNLKRGEASIKYKCTVCMKEH